MILISKQISHSLHTGCRRVWPGWAGLEVLSQFLSQFPQICKISCPMGAADWPVLERTRLTNPLSPGVSCHTGDHWHVLTIDSPWARDTPLTSTGHPWHVPPATDHSSPLTTDQWSPLSPETGHCYLLPPLLSDVTPMAPPIPHCDANKASLGPSSLSQPRMPLVSFQVEYSETENRDGDWINYWLNETWNLHHLAPDSAGWGWGSAQSPRTELKITAALSGADWQLENVLHIRAGFVQTQH